MFIENLWVNGGSFIIIYVYHCLKILLIAWACFFGFLCAQLPSCGFCRRIWRSVSSSLVVSSGVDWRYYTRPILFPCHYQDHKLQEVTFQVRLCWAFSSVRGLMRLRDHQRISRPFWELDRKYRYPFWGWGTMRVS